MNKNIALLLVIGAVFSLLSCNVSDKQMRNELEEYLNTHYVSNSQLFDSLLTRYPASDYLLGLKTYYSIRNRDYAKAEQALEIFVRAYPNLANSQSILRARGLLAQQQQNQAETNKYTRLLEAVPFPDQDKWTNLTLYHLLYEDSTKAATYLQRALTLDPNFTVARIERSYDYDLVANCTEIVSILEGLPESYQDPFVYADLGQAYYNCGNAQKALSYLSKSLAIAPTFNGYYGQALIAHNVHYDYKRAEILYQKAIEYDHNKEFNYSDLGWLYYDLEQIAKAEPYFIQAFDSTQDKYDELTVFYLESKQILKADALNQEAVKRYGNTYQNIGLRILINYNQDDSRKKKFLDELQQYQVKYGSHAQEWLDDTMSNMFERRPDLDRGQLEFRSFPPSSHKL